MAGYGTSIPSLLASHISGPRTHSLLLITHVLGASSNWLLLRLLQSALSSNQTQPETPTGVILISFLRDHSFWRDSGRKLGLDLSRLAAQNRFLFVDGLIELFSGSHAGKPGIQDGHVVLRDPSLRSIEAAVLDLAGRMSANSDTGRTVLIIDGLDFVMAATETTAIEASETMMKWRQAVDSVVVTASADSPLLHDPRTKLEAEHRAHVVGLGHLADRILGLRLLDSGTAKDVSGVLRVSRGAMADERVEEGEYLYFVGGDGTVKVFERGAQ